jgi:hypothetical protein
VRRTAVEVADIFRDHGAAWRSANAGHVSLEQLKVMSAIERCRTAALGGHVARCEDCAHTLIAYNSCRSEHFAGTRDAVEEGEEACVSMQSILAILASCVAAARSSFTGRSIASKGPRFNFSLGKRICAWSKAGNSLAGICAGRAQGYRGAASCRCRSER